MWSLQRATCHFRFLPTDWCSSPHVFGYNALSTAKWLPCVLPEQFGFSSMEKLGGKRDGMVTPFWITKVPSLIVDSGTMRHCKSEFQTYSTTPQGTRQGSLLSGCAYYKAHI